MTLDKTEFARRAVACKGWRWVPGMRVVNERGQVWRLLALDEPGDGVDSREQPRLVPDLDDPATLGCLLALVREAWGGASLEVWGDEGYAEVRLFASGDVTLCGVSGDGIAEALVAALEAAP